MTMKFKNKWLIELLHEDWGDDNPLEVEEDSGWHGDGGKYEHKELIFNYEGKFYRVVDNRTGSYYSSYYCESEDWESEKEHECPEVERIAKTTYVWKAV